MTNQKFKKLVASVEATGEAVTKGMEKIDTLAEGHGTLKDGLAGTARAVGTLCAKMEEIDKRTASLGAASAGSAGASKKKAVLKDDTIGGALESVRAIRKSLGDNA